jgi:hypothetical protein
MNSMNIGGTDAQRLAYLPFLTFLQVCGIRALTFSIGHEL